MSDIHKHMNPEMHECIHNCEDCHDVCLHAVHDCLKKGGKHADAKHIGLLLNCSEMCHTAHDFMVSHSDLHQVTCAACAEVCEACAKSCDEMGDTECAEVCRRCAKTCREMSVAKV